MVSTYGILFINLEIASFYQFGKFLRRFRLCENVKMDEIKAFVENGVLIVTVPKVEEKKPEVKNIVISW